MRVKAFYRRVTDPIATRISCGSSNGEAYIVYRGDLSKVKETISCINEFLQNQKEEGQLDPRDTYENDSN